MFRATPETPNPSQNINFLLLRFIKTLRPVSEKQNQVTIKAVVQASSFIGYLVTARYQKIYH